MRDPSDFEADSFRRKKNGKLVLILGKLKGDTEMTLQAYRYPTSDWSESEAKAHCKKEKGEFHPAAKKEDAPDMRSYFAEFKNTTAPFGYEERWVEGYATTGVTDWYGEIVDPGATERALSEWARWRNLRLMHTANPVGTVEKMEMTDDGLFIGARIIDDEAWSKVKGGALKGFSIGFWPTGYTYDKELDVGVITDYRLVEVSLVDFPANPDCAFTLFRRADTEGEFMAENEDLKTIGQKISDIWSKIFKGGDSVEIDKTKELEKRIAELESESKAKVDGLTTERDTLQAKIDEYEAEKKTAFEAETAAFVDAMVKDKKITPAERDEWVAFYAENPERCRKVAEKLGFKAEAKGSPIEANRPGNAGIDDPETQNRIAMEARADAAKAGRANDLAYISDLMIAKVNAEVNK
jgi:HK97 family phage prohead protease